jgi:hypothetical protein
LIKVPYLRVELVWCLHHDVITDDIKVSLLTTLGDDVEIPSDIEPILSVKLTLTWFFWWFGFLYWRFWRWLWLISSSNDDWSFWRSWVDLDDIVLIIWLTGFGSFHLGLLLAFTVVAAAAAFVTILLFVIGFFTFALFLITFFFSLLLSLIILIRKGLIVPIFSPSVL